MTSTRSRLLLIDQKSSGTVRGHIGADSVSSRVGSGQGLGRVGDGPGSRWGRLRVKSGRVESGSGSSRGRVGVVWGLSPCQVWPGGVEVWVESGTGRDRVGADSVSRPHAPLHPIPPTSLHGGFQIGGNLGFQVLFQLIPQPCPEISLQVGVQIGGKVWISSFVPT